MLIGWGSPTRATSSASPAKSHRPAAVIGSDIGTILTISIGVSPAMRFPLQTSPGWAILAAMVPLAICGLHLRHSILTLPTSAQPEWTYATVDSCKNLS